MLGDYSIWISEMNDSNVTKDGKKGIKNILYKVPATTCEMVQCYLKVDLD